MFQHDLPTSIELLSYEGGSVPSARQKAFWKDPYVSDFFNKRPKNIRASNPMFSENEPISFDLCKSVTQKWCKSTLFVHTILEFVLIYYMLY